MATFQFSYVGNVLCDPDGSKGPLIMPGLFGTGTAIEKGEIIELTGNTNTEWVPLDSDFAMAGNVAIAWENIASGDRTGYYKIAVPRPGDLWRFPLAASGATAIGTALYYSSSKAVTVSAGSNILGNAAGHDHYPDFQGKVTLDGSHDSGTTIRTQSSVVMTFQPSNSYYSAFQTT